MSYIRHLYWTLIVCQGLEILYNANRFLEVTMDAGCTITKAVSLTVRILSINTCCYLPVLHLDFETNVCSVGHVVSNMM
jgi:hypothetical protein